MKNFGPLLVGACFFMNMSCRTSSDAELKDAASSNPASLMSPELSSALVMEVESAFLGDAKAIWKDDTLDLQKIEAKWEMMNPVGDVGDLKNFLVQLNGELVFFPKDSKRKSIQESAMFEAANAFRQGMNTPRAKEDSNWFKGLKLWISCKKTSIATPEFSCNIYKGKYIDGGAAL